MGKKMRYFLLITLFYIGLNGKILEVEQLFNKKLTEVKKEKKTLKKSFYGKTVLDETKVYDIVTRFDGYITNLYANKTYKNIGKNEKLFTIYSDELVTIQQELQVSKKINKNAVNSALEKLRSLDLDENTIKRIKNSNTLIKNIPILSPNNAIVIKKDINNGSFVKKGKLLLQLASYEQIWFIASVYQKDLASIKEGMKAKVYIDGFNKAFETKVDFIYPKVNLENKSVDVRFVIDNKELNLYPNMFAKVDIAYESKEMLTLPKTAVLKKADKYYVFEYLSSKEFEPIEIEAKRISSKKYQVLSGLSEGQKVINNALFLLDSDAVTNGLYTSDDDDW